MQWGRPCELLSAARPRPVAGSPSPHAAASPPPTPLLSVRPGEELALSGQVRSVGTSPAWGFSRPAPAAWRKTGFVLLFTNGIKETQLWRLPSSCASGAQPSRCAVCGDPVLPDGEVPPVAGALPWDPAPMCPEPLHQEEGGPQRVVQAPPDPGTRRPARVSGFPTEGGP